MAPSRMQASLLLVLATIAGGGLYFTCNPANLTNLVGSLENITSNKDRILQSDGVIKDCTRDGTCDATNVLYNNNKGGFWY